MKRLFFIFPVVLLMAFGSYAAVSINIANVSSGVKVTLENSVIKAVYQPNGHDGGMVNFIIKEFNDDVAGGGGGKRLDGGHERYSPVKATIIDNSTNKKCVEIEWEKYGKSQITIVENNPVLKIYYLNMWHIFEWGANRGTTLGRFDIYGAAAWKSQLNAPKLYWYHGDSFNGGEYYNSSKYGTNVPLNYNGHVILGMYNAVTQRGFVRVMPIAKLDKLKLMDGCGFEMYRNKVPFVGYLGVITGGSTGVMTLGKQLADGNYLTLGPVEDKTPPTVSSVASSGPTQVTVTFSEAVDKTSAEAVGNYAMNGITISSASLSGNTVTLTTGTLASGVTYTLTVSNIKDLNGNTMTSAQKTFSYVEFCGWSEDFNDGTADGWTTGGGTWSVSGGEYANSGSGRKEAFGGDANWTDITYECDITPVSGTDVWAIFRVQDKDNYYLYTLSTSKLYKLVGGSFTQLATGTGSYTAGNTYHIKVELAGNSIKIYKGTTQVLSATDNTFAKGKIGFGGNNGTGKFDNATVPGNCQTGIMVPSLSTTQGRSGIKNPISGEGLEGLINLNGWQVFDLTGQEADIITKGMYIIRVDYNRIIKALVTE